MDAAGKLIAERSLAHPGFSAGEDTVPANAPFGALSAPFTLKMAAAKTPPPLAASDQLAGRIDAHLRRFENDPLINAPVGAGKHPNVPYFVARAAAGADSQVYVQYFFAAGDLPLSPEAAACYLAWLDAGHTGTHYDCFSETVDADGLDLGK